MIDRYFMHGREQWRCSVAVTPAAPAGRPRGAVSVEEGRTRLYFWSASGVMRSVLYPAPRRLTEEEIRSIPDDELRALLLAPDTTEMGRLPIAG
jgi:hypothetical protein